MSAPLAGLLIRHDLKPSAPPAEVVAVVDSGAAEKPPADLWVWAARYKVGDVVPYLTWSTLQRWY